MKYKQAFCCSNAVDGIIKCTWAKIYDENGDTVFTLVNKRFTKDTIVPAGDYYHNQFGETSDEHYTTSVIGQEDRLDLDLAWTSARIFEPVVKCTEFVDGYRVPVQLYSANVGVAFKNSLADVSYTVNRNRARKLLWNRNEDAAYSRGSYAMLDGMTDEQVEKYIDSLVDDAKKSIPWDLVMQGASYYGRNDERMEYLLARRLQQIEDINNGKTFWVKVKCFDWYPIDAKVPSKAEVQRAAEEVRKAKLILAAAAASTVIS